MKKTVVLLWALLPVFGFSQSIFDKYEDMDEVGAVIINKGLINLLSSINLDDADKEAREFMEVAQGIDGIKVFMTEDKTVSQDMRSTVSKYQKSASLEEMMRVKDNDTRVKFYVRNGKKDSHVRELLMFVSGIEDKGMDLHGRKFESVLVSMTGDIDLNKIGALTNKMGLPEELEKAGER